MTGFLSDDARWDFLASLSPRERAFVTKKIAKPNAKPIEVMREIEPDMASHCTMAKKAMANEVVQQLLADADRRAFHAADVSLQKITAELALVAFGSVKDLVAEYGALDIKMSHKLEAVEKLAKMKGAFVDRKEHSLDKSLVELLTLGEDSDTGPGPSSGQPS